MAEDGQADGQKQEYQLKEPHSFKICSSTMSEAFELDAINTALIAVDKYKHLKGGCSRTRRLGRAGLEGQVGILTCLCLLHDRADIAFYIKHEYDRKYPGSGKATEGVYHCIVGKSFASASWKFLRMCIRWLAPVNP